MPSEMPSDLERVTELARHEGVAQGGMDQKRDGDGRATLVARLSPHYRAERLPQALTGLEGVGEGGER